jgi:8-oxo-dGTP pyrophosphatase MutT (NUDIX family)
MSLEPADSRRGFLVCVEVIDVIDAFHFVRGADRRETIGITFHCRAAEGDVKLSDEHDDARWVPLDRLGDAPYPDWLRRAAVIIAARVRSERR